MLVNCVEHNVRWMFKPRTTYIYNMVHKESFYGGTGEHDT